MGSIILIAFCRLYSVLHTTSVNRLNRINSCLSTVFMDSSKTTGYLFITISMSNGGGNLDKMSADSSSITSAEDFPPPPVWRGRVNKMLSNNYEKREKEKKKKNYSGRIFTSVFSHLTLMMILQDHIFGKTDLYIHKVISSLFVTLFF